MVNALPRNIKVFDAFLFDGELDLLEHRLAETWDLVDRYVLVEAAETFQGQSKPLNYAANRARFVRYADKIRHLPLPSLGKPSGADTEAAWARERYQRNSILFALHDALPDDVLLILDADEIPSRELLRRLRGEGLNAPCRLLMTRHYQAVDLLAPASACCPDVCEPFPFARGTQRPQHWNCLSIEWFSRSGVALPMHALTGASEGSRRAPHDLRRLTPLAGALPAAGRHLCFVDPSAQAAHKLSRTAHTELAMKRDLDPLHQERCRTDAVHHRGWWYAERPSGPLPADLERLARRCPQVQAAVVLPSRPHRVAVRTWAWLRVWPFFSDQMVRRMERLPVMAKRVAVPALVILDGLRGLSARVLRGRRPGSAPCHA